MNPPELDIPAFLERCAHLRVLVVGDLMLDHYIDGDALRISPEAPVPVVHVEQDRYVPGGAANVAANLAGLGVRTTLAGTYGTDEAGRKLEELLQARGIQLSPLGQRAHVDTIIKSRVVVRRQQLCRLDREGSPESYAIGPVVHTPEFRQLVESSDAVILSDYAKGVLTDPFLEALRGLVSSTSGERPLLVLDPKPKRALKLDGLDLITPNWSEALQLAGLPEDRHAQPDRAEVARRIGELHRPHALVITLGAEGMLLCEEGRVTGHLPTQAREVFDVSGAGDTVIATVAAALAAGFPLVEAAAYANFAAGIVVGHIGTAPITREDLLGAVR